MQRFHYFYKSNNHIRFTHSLRRNSEALILSIKQMAHGGDKPYLPPEIIVNILKRLPVKSIVRFRCVCKDWKNLFKTPYFIAEHASHSAHDPLLLLHETDFDYWSRSPSLRLVNHGMETVDVLSIPSIDCLKHGWSITGSCNGLLCVEVALHLDKSPYYLCLWNPVIGDVRKIPQTEKDYWGFSAFGFGFGFGYSSIINDYKIVKFYNQESRPGAEVYSLRRGSWKELEFGALQNTTIISKPVSADGTIHWLGMQDSFHVLVSFDIATEVFTLTPIPLPSARLGFEKTTTTLGVYLNKFSIFRHYHYGSHNFIDIWVMEEVASESGKRFICIEEYYNIRRIAFFFLPLCIWRNEIVCRVKDTEDQDEPKFFLQMFNVTTQKWKGFHDSPNYDFCAAFNYEESLVSVWNTHQAE